jgi:hypothetical protein
MSKWSEVPSGKVISAVVAVAWHVFLSSVAKPQEVRIDQYRHPKTKEFHELDRLYLGGIKSGLTWYNAYLISEHQKPAFCLPDNLALTNEQAEDILLRWAKKNRPPDDFPISLALLYGLQETFPCRGK